ncbi:Aralkylamine dehydrogenase heavy chain [Paraburkholderia caffeinitolerans]|uniref:Aralkylamine dehydrogenase heavy chain n=1 Tax=Paraburkholderia caffeinitolerans TaxID=1723730 RepID=A0A6J5FID0_9BURK|nr:MULTISPECIES: amine dehydrogenase large subunit [Paraburkholderia]CAB3778339.1 Aralkylamine dehydrogenase heavy chain [Paraburkholderia caffeinitolerans]
MTIRKRAAAAAAVLAFACAATAAEKPEELTIQKMPAWHPHEIFIVDPSGDAATDGRIYVYDADARKELGQIDAGFLPGFAISPDHKTSVVATTYFSRGSHGTRTDVMEFTDNSTLDHAGEAIIPSKHAQSVPSAWNTTFSSDGKHIYVSNLTPAASVSVVDAHSRKLAGEIDMAACVLALPSGPNKFTALCESGKALTITLDAAGKESRRVMSEPFIDVERDPAFANASPWQGGYVFTTFHGMVRTANFRGDKAVFGAAWPLVTDAERASGWRPGGLQPTAVHDRMHRLYVAMHQGADGSHKEPASEIWVFDLNSHKRVARWSLADQKIPPLVVSVQVSQDDRPLLYGLTLTGDLVVLDAQTGKLRSITQHVARTPTLLVNP